MSNVQFNVMYVMYSLTQRHFQSAYCVHTVCTTEMSMERVKVIHTRVHPGCIQVKCAPGTIYYTNEMHFIGGATLIRGIPNLTSRS